MPNLYNEIKEHNWKDDSEKNTAADGEGDDGRQQEGEGDEPELDVEREGCVDRVHVGAEVIEDAAERRRVEERHRSSKQSVEGVRVEDT